MLTTLSHSCGLFRSTPRLLNRNPHRIVIPRLPSQSTISTSTGTTSARGPSSTASFETEYEEHKDIPAHTRQFLDRSGADALQRQQQLNSFHEATEATTEQVWRDSKPHLRRQKELIQEYGVEGAVRETLSPSGTSFTQELRSRPLDRAILEEIYLGLHGRRIERRLKKGVSWEHWIAKGDGTAPVYTTSVKGQQTFAFGGRVRRVAVATHPQQFPSITLAGRAALVQAAASLASTNTSQSQNKKKRFNAHAAVIHDRQLLVPEVAFIGRTSSGKSSLVNAIVNATVAPYGHLQGTTSSVDFYSIADKVMLVDCPGYGYYSPMETPQLDAECAVKAMRAYLKAGARRHASSPPLSPSTASTMSAAASQSTSVTAVEETVNHDGYDDGKDLKNGEEGEYEGGSMTGQHQHQQQQQLQQQYGSSLNTQTPSHPRTSHTQPRNIKRVFLCVPAKGLQHTDLAYCQMLEHLGIPFSVVFTKTDSAPIRMLARLADHTRCQLVQYKQCKELLLTSSLRLAGVDKMQSLIASVAVTEDPMDGATMDFTSIV